MFSFICAIISISILVWVVKFRIHVTVCYTPSNSRGYKAARKTIDAHARAKRRQVDPVPTQQPAWGAELLNALRGLGCTAKAAREAVDRALATNPATFEAALRGAIREATA